MPLPAISPQREVPLTLRILVVDAHTAFRQALAYVLEQEPDFTVVAQASGLADARAVLEGVDVATIELQLADGSGCDLVRPCCVTNPQGAVLILTSSRDRGDYAQAMLAGAAGVMHTSVGLPEIISAVRRLGQGQALLAPTT
jgi:DNA-binding NarL/FixJ family response regulator